MIGRGCVVSLRVLAGCLVGVLGGATACGEDGAPPGVVNSRDPDMHDAGREPSEPDARVPDIMRDPLANRDVPAAIKDQSCAVEIDKLYQLAEVEGQPEPTRLAADVVGSRFAVSYVGPSATCIEALFVAQIEGGSAEPTVTTALDNCTKIQHATLAHNGRAWLLASVDTRMGAQDLWVQTFDRTPGVGHRISDSPGAEDEPSLAMNSDGQLVAAWTEFDVIRDTAKLLARPLSRDGTPTSDIVVLEDASGVSFASLALSPIGTRVALVYRRSERSGGSRIVLELLDAETGQRTRDPWILTSQAGPFGTASIAGDEEGGAVAYSVVDGGRSELWLQALGANGAAAPVQSAGREGGASEPSRAVGPPYRAIDGSVAKIPAGYALAYRALPGGQVTSPQIRVHFLDHLGHGGGVSSVALASESGGRTGIVTGYDGRMVIAWTDSSEDGTSRLMAVRVPCVAGP